MILKSLWILWFKIKHILYSRNNFLNILSYFKFNKCSIEYIHLLIGIKQNCQLLKKIFGLGQGEVIGAVIWW